RPNSRRRLHRTTVGLRMRTSSPAPALGASPSPLRLPPGPFWLPPGIPCAVAVCAQPNPRMLLRWLVAGVASGLLVTAANLFVEAREAGALHAADFVLQGAKPVAPALQEVA